MTAVTLTRDDLKLAVKHLKDGRTLLSKRGVWIKGSVEENQWQRVCSLGALYKVSGQYEQGSPYSVPAVRFLDCALGGDGGGGHIVEFNDAWRTTRANVLSAWDKAIKLAKDALAKASPKTQMRKISRARD